MPRTRPAGCLAWWLVAGLLTQIGCGSQTPTAPTAPPISTVQLDALYVTDAMNYWASVTGITYVIAPDNSGPRLFMQPVVVSTLNGALATGGFTSVAADGEILSGIVNIGQDVATYCTPSAAEPSYCRGIFRHEVGHALGHTGHVIGGLMSPSVGVDAMTGAHYEDQLSAQSFDMMSTLYALPVGAKVLADGTWTAPGGASGRIADPQVAQDILTLNATAAGLIRRWQSPVTVYFKR